SPRKKILQGQELLSGEQQAADSSKLATYALPERKLPRRKHETLLSRLLFYVCKRRTEVETTTSRACDAVISSPGERRLPAWSYRQLVALRRATLDPVKFFCAG